MAKSLIFVVNLFSSSYSLMMLVALWRRTASSWTRTGSAQHCRRHACHSSPSEPQWNPSVAVWWSGWWAQGGHECCQSKSLIWFPGWRFFSQSLHSFHLSRKSCHTWYSGSGRQDWGDRKQRSKRFNYSCLRSKLSALQTLTLASCWWQVCQLTK